MRSQGRRQRAPVGAHHHALRRLAQARTRFNGFPAVKITGSQAAGYSSGQALQAMEEVARETLPGGFSYAWSGQALQEKDSGSTSSSAFVSA